MENAYVAMVAGLLILVASMASVEMGLSVAPIEIAFGVVAGNFLGLHTTPWIDFLASFAGIVLTFLAGAEVESPHRLGDGAPPALRRDGRRGKGSSRRVRSLLPHDHKRRPVTSPRSRG